MMTRKEIMQEFKTVNERLLDIEKRLSQFSESMHNESSGNIEDLNVAVAELADEVYKEEQ